MTSVWKRLGLGLAIATGAQVTASAATPPAAPPPRVVRAGPAQVAPVAPAYLRERINALGRQFDGRVGIAVTSVDDGWTAGWKADELYPQQSVSKLWVAIAALDAADKGRVKMSDKIGRAHV